jgi:hypothetical protein
MQNSLSKLTNDQLDEIYYKNIGYRPIAEDGASRASVIEILSGWSAESGADLKVDIRYNYYDNSNLCAECTGAGCKNCLRDNTLGLLAWGTDRFPLALAVNGCRPPAIVNYYASRFNRFAR